MKKDTDKLMSSYTYHVFARTNNKELLFTQERNYEFFLKRYEEYIVPVAHTLSYCLLPNHIHFMIGIREAEVLQTFCDSIFAKEDGKQDKKILDIESIVSYQFQRLLTSYVKAFNKQENRYGNLIQRPFKRKLISDEEHYFYNIYYIHNNPRKHGFVKDFKSYRWSSYLIFFTDAPTFIEREEVLFHFDGLKDFAAYHGQEWDDKDWEFEEGKK
jgi:putative transposase